MSDYRLLASVRVLHEYDAPVPDRAGDVAEQHGPCDAVSFVPTERTARLLRNAPLLVKHGAGAVSILQDTAAPEALGAHADEQGLVRLFLRLEADDPLFWAYTDPQPKRADSLLCFEPPEGAAPGGDAIRLHPANSVDESDFRDVRSLSVPYLRELLDLPGSLSDDEVMELELAGRFEREHSHRALVGLVHVPLDPAADPVTYEIRFAASRSHWKYYVLDPLADAVEQRGATVVDAARAVEFEPAEGVRLPGGRRAVTFRSTTPLPVRARSAFVFQLREAGGDDENGGTNGSGRILIRRLPVASAGALEVDAVGGKSVMVSDIYVNG